MRLSAAFPVLTTAVLLNLAAGSSHGQTYYCSHIEGLQEPGRVRAGETITLYHAFPNDSTPNLQGKTAGFEIFSQGDAAWDSVAIGWAPTFAPGD